MCPCPGPLLHDLHALGLGRLLDVKWVEKWGGRQEEDQLIGLTHL